MILISFLLRLIIYENLFVYPNEYSKTCFCYAMARIMEEVYITHKAQKKTEAGYEPPFYRTNNSHRFFFWEIRTPSS